MIVSCGVKHIKFWTLSGNTLSAKKGLFKITKTLCTAFSVYCIFEKRYCGERGVVFKNLLLVLCVQCVE